MSRSDFNFGWRFRLGDPPGAQAQAFDDRAWRELRLPHDWSVEARFDAELEGATAYLPGGIGWYRKRFPWTPDDHLYFLLFDGVYNHATVWINGHELGYRPYGYVPFYFEITPYLEASNVVAVRVDRSRYADSRWYPGSGIYRNVTLVRKNKLHLPLWSGTVTTPSVTAERATVRLELEVANRFAEPVEAALTTQILDSDDRIVAEAETTVALAGQAQQQLEQRFTVEEPALWSPDAPQLYRAVSRLERRGALVDTQTIRFGIRTFAFDANEGFWLNGARLPIKGVCLHHDGGLVGAAVPDAVWRRRLQTLEAGGCNAIRIAHNPASEAFLDLCDELGFLVQEEFFDEWDFPKDKRLNKNELAPDPITEGYARWFPAWAERDLKDTVRRDRNHPSIVQWSIGNEIEWTYARYRYATGYNEPSWEGNFFWDLPPYEPQEIAERFFEAPEAGASLAETAHRLARWTKELDATRPVIANCIFPSVSHISGFTEALDVVGYSYRRILYDSGHERYPDKPIMGTENVGQWHEWKAVIERPFIAGLFLWTGIDYLGEAHGQWPAKSLHTGLLDLAGFPKPSYHMFAALWRSEPCLRIFTQTLEASPYRLDEQGEPVARDPDGWQRRVWFWHDVNEHWNYPPGEMVVVEIYSNCEVLELLLDGRSLGRKHLGAFDDRIVRWAVPFEEGALTARGWASGAVPGNAAVEQQLHTASLPARIRLSCDRTELRADSYDCAHITAQLEDAAGRPVRHVECDIAFQVDGDCRVLGVDNGRAAVDAFQTLRLRTHQGRALLIVQANQAEAQLRVQVTAEAQASPIASSILELTTRKPARGAVEARSER